MIKTLVAVDADLASSIAIRYICQLAGLVQLQLQTIHVGKQKVGKHPPGTGWVRESWEKTLLREDQAEIMRLIQAERTTCADLTFPKIVVGEHDEQILNELRLESYDLFVEGLLHTYASDSFYNKLRSSLYRNLPCPAIVVKNLIKLERIAILLNGAVDFRNLVSGFAKIFKGVGLGIHLFYCRIQSSDQKDLTPRPSGTAQTPESMLDKAARMLSGHGLAPEESRLIEAPPEKLANHLRPYGLVAASMGRVISGTSPLLGLLNQVQSPLFLGWY